MDWKPRISVLILWLALIVSSIEDGNSEQRIVCYYTNWSVYRPGTAKFSPQNINPYLCTHLIYAFGGFTKDNTLKPFDKYQDIEKGGYAKFTGLKTYNKNLKTMLAIGGWNEGSSRFSPMVADPGRRKEFVKNSVKFLRQNHFDGLDLDWEYPAFRDGGKPRDRNNYADLVQELREEFERESSKTGRKRLLLSMAVPAGIEYIDKGYDVPRLNDYLDFINLLSYDYHSAFEPAVNHHAPLYSLEEDNEYNYDSKLTIDYTIGHLLKSGASSEKIVLGIPTYGRSYTLINEDANDIGAPADGPGEEGDATREKGYLAYYEICENIGKSDEWEVVQPNPKAMGPYAFRNNQWVGYDDEDIVRAKARYVIEKKLGGIMFWSIDNDDFRGKCHGRPYPLIEAAKEELLAGSERSNSRQNTKLSDNRKVNRIQGGQRIQGNAISRKLGTGNRRTSTQTPIARRRIGTSRSNARSNAKSNVRTNNNADDDDEEADEEEEEEENDTKVEANAVKAVEKPRTRIRSKNQSKNRVSGGGRRKQQGQSRQNEEKEADTTNEESLSNSFTTPEPPTTPDPGSDFKCEDEGFFSHPRDCKKYFWCLDSGPGGLGIVGHQFTCPSGLVFNKAADSCDYPRNVACPKKISQSNTVTTTKAPTTAATSRPSNLHKSPKRTTTPKPEVEEEEYEYYEEEEIEDSDEAKEEPTTTSKPLRYKTISRSRPTTTTSTPSTTTMEAAIVASTRAYKTTPDRVASFEDEEDPRVLKELIDLIKKAGGIEQLEKQLLYQEKNSGGNIEKNENNGKSTPATISRSLYERVLSRQATRIAGSFLGSLSTTQSTNGDKTEDKTTKRSRIGFVNGPGGAQFEGLDNVPEVKSLRRANKPKYVTIERHRSSTIESPAEKHEDYDEEAIEEVEVDDDDNTDVASSEDRAISDSPQQRNPNRRVTPSYVNIRRSRPSKTSENDVEAKDEDTKAEEDSESVTERDGINKTEEESTTGSNFRYTNIHRFRSTTSRNNEVDQTVEISEKNEMTTEAATTTEKLISMTKEIPETSTIPSTTTLEPITTSESLVTSTIEQISSALVESSTESSTLPLTTDLSLKLVEESATEILFTTAPASSNSPDSNPETFTRGPSVAIVSQPRPFGFPRRGRPTAFTSSSTSSMTSVTERSRPKIDLETLRLPTLKELVGYSTTVTESISDSTSTFVPSAINFVNVTIDNKELRKEQVDRTIFKNRLENLIQDIFDDDNDTRRIKTSRDKEIIDNDILGSEEIQRHSFSSSLSSAASGIHRTRSTEENNGINDKNQSYRSVEVPVQILDDTNDEGIAELVLLRIPENKFNSAILKPVFRVKILEADRKVNFKDSGRNGIESSVNNTVSSSENELSGDRRQSSRRNRINSSSAFAASTNETQRRNNGGNYSRSRQRILKARVRTRVEEAPSNRTDDFYFHSQDEKLSKSFDNLNEKLENLTNTPTLLTDTSTTIGATTIRGKRPTSSKPSNITNGFYITRSGNEISTPIPNIVITEPSIDSTEYSSTINNDFIEESTRTTNFSTFIPQVERIYSNDDSTTKITNQIDSLDDISRSKLDEFETLTSLHPLRIENNFTDSFNTKILTTKEDEENIEEFSVTTFRTFTDKSASDSTIPMESATKKYSIDNRTEEIDEYTATTIDESTRELEDIFQTLENSHYNYLSTLEIDTSTQPMIRVENNTSIENKTEEPLSETTNLNDKATTSIDSLKRGRIRFTRISKPTVTRALEYSRDYPRKTKKFDDLRINFVTPVEFTSMNDAATEVYDKTTDPTIIGTDAIDLNTNYVKITTKLPSNGKSIEVYDNNEENITASSEAEEMTLKFWSTLNPIDELWITNKSFDTEDSTIASTKPEEFIATSATVSETYDVNVHRSSVNASNYENSDFGETTANPLYKKAMLEDSDTTTEIYDKKTDLPGFVTIREDVNPMESTIISETTVASTTITKPWIYNRQRNVNRILEENKTENINIFSDSRSRVDSITERTVTTVDTGATYTEFNEEQEISTEAKAEKPVVTENINIFSDSTLLVNSTTDDSITTVDTDATYTEINEQQEKFTEAFESTKFEESTSIDTIENIESTTIAATTVNYFSKHNKNLNETRMKMENHDKNDYSKANSTSVTPLETIRTRGRVRFTNFAGNTDESGINRRPVKQVLVRRRLANPLNDQQRINDSIEEKIRKEHKIAEKVKNDANESSIEEKRNSTKSMRRRLVIYRSRPRAENVSTTTVQSSSVESNNFSQDIGKTSGRKWRKRLVSKRAKIDELEDDQNIAESQTIVDYSVDENLPSIDGPSIIRSVDQKFVNSSERQDEDIGDGEVNIYKSSGSFSRTPGTLVRPESFNRSRTKSPGILLPIGKNTDRSAVPFSKIRPIDTTEYIKTDDQSERAQELTVTLADPPEIRATANNGRLEYGTTTRKISTTIAPRTEAQTRSRTTSASRRRQGPRGNRNNEKIIENVSTKPRRPAIIDYDYYVDDEIRLVLKPELKDKLYVTHKGGIRCLDQGNFAHPTSCKKFITCARMVNGQVLGTEYTCPDKLSFDPVGGICNWSAGLGCEDKKIP